MFFYRLGSDAEFVFVRMSEFKPVLINAQFVVGTNKSVTLASFIGTDGHAATAELRPRPAHNIRMHLADIAAGITMSADVLKHKKMYADVRMLARPCVEGSTMAGHIHISFFVDEPATRVALAQGYIYNSQLHRLDSLFHNPGTVGALEDDLASSIMSSLAIYARQAYNGETMGPYFVASRLAWLLHPLEVWLQPWHERIQRNHSYGLGGDIVRWNSPGTKPDWKHLQHLAYLHYEYRTPSTWLIHPALAYVYLALAKITMTNWKLISKLYTQHDEHEVIGICLAKTPQNELAGKLFANRLLKAKEAGLRLTRDTQWLHEALKICVALREHWYSAPSPIDVEAWRAWV